MIELLIFGIVCLLPVFVIPFLVGVWVLYRPARLPFTSCIGWLTIKPVWVVPLWLLIYLQLDLSRGVMTWGYYNGLLAVASVLPDVLSTAVIIWLYRSDIRDNMPQVVLLLTLDAIRWGTLLWIILVQINGAGIYGWQYLVALGMPTLFAFVAWMITTMDQDEELLPVPTE